MAAQAVQNVEGAISAVPHGPASRRGTFVSMLPEIQISHEPYGPRFVPRSLYDLSAADGWAADPSTQPGASAWSMEIRQSVYETP